MTSPDDFRVHSNWDGDLSLSCPEPDCWATLPIKDNGNPISDLRKLAKKHLKREHSDVLLVATKAAT